MLRTTSLSRLVYNASKENSLIHVAWIFVRCDIPRGLRLRVENDSLWRMILEVRTPLTIRLYTEEFSKDGYHQAGFAILDAS